METSWNSVGKWYDRLVDKEGHYYHKNVILPRLAPFLEGKETRLLDLACGQGVLQRAFPDIGYLGVDVAKSLIKKAQSRGKKDLFMVGDITKPLKLHGTFTHASLILAFQNLEKPEGALANAKKYLEKGGTLIIVLNHPCFRIPRQSSWGVDEPKKLQYRRIDRYMTPLKVPIQMHPGQTWSYHHSISDISTMLANTGFIITRIEEWCSDKASTGKCAKRENMARKEFPLFFTIVAQSIK